jgi:hypothetical protein
MQNLQEKQISKFNLLMKAFVLSQKEENSISLIGFEQDSNGKYFEFKFIKFSHLILDSYQMQKIDKCFYFILAFNQYTLLIFLVLPFEFIENIFEQKYFCYRDADENIYINSIIKIFSFKRDIKPNLDITKGLQVLTSPKMIDQSPLIFYYLKNSSITIVKIHQKNSNIIIKNYKFSGFLIYEIKLIRIHQEFTGEDLEVICTIYYENQNQELVYLHKIILPNLENEIILNSENLILSKDSYNRCNLVELPNSKFGLLHSLNFKLYLLIFDDEIKDFKEHKILNKQIIIDHSLIFTDKLIIQANNVEMYIFKLEESSCKLIYSQLFDEWRDRINSIDFFETINREIFILKSSFNQEIFTVYKIDIYSQKIDSFGRYKKFSEILNKTQNYISHSSFYKKPFILNGLELHDQNIYFSVYTINNFHSELFLNYPSLNESKKLKINFLNTKLSLNLLDTVVLDFLPILNIVLFFVENNETSLIVYDYFCQNTVYSCVDDNLLGSFYNDEEKDLNLVLTKKLVKINKTFQTQEYDIPNKILSYLVAENKVIYLISANCVTIFEKNSFRNYNYEKLDLINSFENLISWDNTFPNIFFVYKKTNKTYYIFKANQTKIKEYEFKIDYLQSINQVIVKHNFFLIINENFFYLYSYTIITDQLKYKHEFTFNIENYKDHLLDMIEIDKNERVSILFIKFDCNVKDNNTQLNYILNYDFIKKDHVFLNIMPKKYKLLKNNFNYFYNYSYQDSSIHFYPLQQDISFDITKSHLLSFYLQKIEKLKLVENRYLFVNLSLKSEANKINNESIKKNYRMIIYDLFDEKRILCNLSYDNVLVDFLFNNFVLFLLFKQESESGDKCLIFMTIILQRREKEEIESFLFNLEEKKTMNILDQSEIQIVQESHEGSLFAKKISITKIEDTLITELKLSQNPNMIYFFSKYGNIKIFLIATDLTLDKLYEYNMSSHLVEISKLKSEYINKDDMLRIFQQDQDMKFLNTYILHEIFRFQPREISNTCQLQFSFSFKYYILILNFGLIIFKFSLDELTSICSIKFHQQITFGKLCDNFKFIKYQDNEIHIKFESQIFKLHFEKRKFSLFD